MKNKLVGLEVDRVDLVGEGANSQSFIKIYKKKEGGTSMNYEEVLAALPEDQRLVVEEHVTAAIEKAKKVDEPEGEEEILKNLDPTVLAIIEKSRTQARAAEEAVRKMIEKETQAEAIAKAKELSDVGVPQEDLTELYKSLNGADQVLADKVFTILKTANEVVKNSKAFDSVGNNGEEGVDSDAAWAKIEAKADEIAKVKSITKEAAVSEAIDQNPDLYKQYVKGL